MPSTQKTSESAFYNNVRLHSSLSYQPTAYEREQPKQPIAVSEIS